MERQERLLSEIRPSNRYSKKGWLTHRDSIKTRPGRYNSLCYKAFEIDINIPGGGFSGKEEDNQTKESRTRSRSRGQRLHSLGSFPIVREGIRVQMDSPRTSYRRVSGGRRKSKAAAFQRYSTEREVGLVDETTRRIQEQDELSVSY